MSRTLTRAGLLVDSWRDQPPQTEPSQVNPLGGAIPISRLHGTSEDVPSAPRLTSLTSLIELSAMKWGHAEENL
jgi:hypothetical protein